MTNGSAPDARGIKRLISNALAIRDIIYNSQVLIPVCRSGSKGVIAWHTKKCEKTFSRKRSWPSWLSHSCFIGLRWYPQRMGKQTISLYGWSAVSPLVSGACSCGWRLSTMTSPQPGNIRPEFHRGRCDTDLAARIFTLRNQAMWS